jgi:hypothetical protein
MFLLVTAALSALGTCWWNGTGNSTFVSGIDKTGDAWASFTKTLNSMRFNHIGIETNGASPSTSQLYCAGYVDARLTQPQIWQRHQLYKDIEGVPRDSPWPANWTNWLGTNMNYMRQRTTNASHPYWWDIALVLTQFDRFVAGYGAAGKNTFGEREPQIL